MIKQVNKETEEMNVAEIEVAEDKLEKQLTSKLTNAINDEN